jgi:hypothetical protein
MGVCTKGVGDGSSPREFINREGMQRGSLVFIRKYLVLSSSAVSSCCCSGSPAGCRMHHPTRVFLARSRVPRLSRIRRR